MRPLLTQGNYRLHEEEIRRQLERAQLARSVRGEGVSHFQPIFRTTALAILAIAVLAVGSIAHVL